MWLLLDDLIMQGSTNVVHACPLIKFCSGEIVRVHRIITLFRGTHHYLASLEIVAWVNEANIGLDHLLHHVVVQEERCV